MGDRLAGKVAILAGGATGMGRATAIRFAEEGAKVMIADRNLTAAEQTRVMVQGITQDVDVVGVDVSKWDQVQDMVNVTVKRFGRVDILVNLAAILMLTPPLVDVEERQWDLIMDTNLKGPFLCCKAAIPEMLKGKGGSIINISSTAGIESWTRSLPYNISKAGVIHLTSVMAGQYTAKNIRINCVVPGPVDTPQARGSTQSHESLESVALGHPMGRVGRPEEIANAILFLASEESSFVSGATYVVDGGAMVGWRRS